MKRILRRLKLVFDNPKRTIKHFVFKLYIMLDWTYKNTWKIVDQTPGWLSKYEGYLLFYLARKCSPLRTIVEIGSYEGRSTIALASGAHEGLIIHAIDPHTGDKTEVEAGLKINTYESFLKNTKNFNNIHAIRKFSVDATQDVSDKAIQLLFIDGCIVKKQLMMIFNLFYHYYSAVAQLYLMTGLMRKLVLESGKI